MKDAVVKILIGISVFALIFGIGIIGSRNNKETTSDDTTDESSVTLDSPDVELSETAGFIRLDETNSFTIKSKIEGTISVKSGSTKYIQIVKGDGEHLSANSEKTIEYKCIKEMTKTIRIKITFKPKDTSKYEEVIRTYNVALADKKVPTLSVKIEGKTLLGEKLEAKVETDSSGKISYQWWYCNNNSGKNKIYVLGEGKNFTITETVLKRYVGVTVKVAEDKYYKEAKKDGITETTCQTEEKEKLATSSANPNLNTNTNTPPGSLIAHMGYNTSSVPGNSKKAFTNAGTSGKFVGIEADIRANSGGTLVCSHGTNISSTACTVSDCLDICKKYNLIPIFDMKTSKKSNINKLCKLVKSKGMENAVIYQTGNTDVMKTIRSYQSNARLWYLAYRVKPTTSLITTAKKNGCEGINVNYEPSQSFINTAHNNGLKVCRCEYDTPANRKKMTGYGVDYLMVNRP